MANPANSVVNLTLAVTDQISPAMGNVGREVAKLASQIGELSIQFLNLAGTTGNFAINFVQAIANLPNTLRDLSNTLDEAGFGLDQFIAGLEDVSQYSTGETLAGIGELLRVDKLIPDFVKLKAETAGLTGAIASKLTPALTILDQGFIAIVKRAEDLTAKAANLSGTLGEVFAIPSGAREPLIVFEALREAVTKVTGGIFNLVQEIGLFGLGLDALRQLVNTGPFRALIGQNEELRQQLLATQATLVGTSQIFQGGALIGDPTQAIKALEGPIKNAIDDLREGSLELVGVTSKELVPVFQIVAGQVTQMGGSLDQAVQLSLDFAASLGTLQIPLFQANQEIRSMLTGTIDQNSILAKSLNLNNQQVMKWKEQGVLIDKLRERLSAFRAGNALAAQTLSGITSNIQEIFDEITRKAGEPLLQPLVKELDLIYKSLNQNREALTRYISGLAANGLRAVQGFYKAIQILFGSIGEATGQIPAYLFETLANGAESLAEALKNALAILQPFINLFAKLAGSAISAAGPFFTLFLQFKLLQGGIKLLGGSLNTLFEIIPGLGEALFFLKGRTSTVLGTFLGLRRDLGPVGAALLVLGQRLGGIAPLFNAVAGSMPLLGGGLARNIPLFANFAVAIAGASQQSGLLREFLGRTVTVLASLTGQSGQSGKAFEILGKILGSNVGAISQLAGAAGLPLLSKELGNLSGQLTKGTLASTLLNNSVKSLKTSVISFLTGTVAATAAFAAFGFAFDKLVLQNQNLLVALGAFVSFVGEVSRSIFQFLTHPLTLATIAVTVLAVAIQAKLIPAIAQLIAVKLSGFLLGAATSLQAFSVAAAGLKLTELATGASLASTGFAQMAAAMTGGAAAAGTFTAGLGSLALGLFALLAPLVAIAGGIATIGFARYGKDLKESIEAFEIYRQQSNAVADDALQVASKIKKASDRSAEAQRTGIALSNEEIAANAKLAQSGKQRIAALDDQIKILQLAQKLAQKEAVGDKIRNAFGAQLAMLEATRKALEKYLNTVQIAPRSLPELGNAFDQLAAKAEAAQKAIANPQGDVETFKKKVEEYQTVTQQQAAIGAISLAEAEKRYREIANLSTLEADTQIKAAELAVGARKEQLKQESDLTKALVEQRQAAIAAGSVDEYTGFAEIFKLQREDLENQKFAIEEALILEAKAGRGRGKIARELYLEKKSLETQLTTLTSEELNKRIELENRYLDNIRDRATNAIALAETEQQRSIQELYNQREITQTEADERRVNLTRDRLQRELALEQANLQVLTELQTKATDPQKKEEQERQIRASRLKTAQLTTQLAEQQQREQEAIAKTIQERISREQKAIENLATKQNQAYEKQLQLLNKLNGTLEQQNKLIESRKELTGAIGDFLQTEYKILIETAKTDAEKQRLTQKAAATELRFLAERQRLDRESLEIKLQLRRAEDERLKIESQAAQLTAAANIKSAQAEYAKAEANPQATQEELEALRLSVEAAVSKLDAERAKGELLGAQASFNRREESTERRTLALKQAGELDQKRFEYGKTLPESEQNKFFERLRTEIFQRLSGTDAIAPSDIRSGTRRRYTPTTYGTLGRIDPETGEYIPAPKSVSQPSPAQVGSVPLPSLKEAQIQSKATLDMLREQFNLKPANQHLQSLVGLQKEGNQILLAIANDPKTEIQYTTYNQSAERNRSNRGLPR
jgi:hypothetical protein